MASLYSVTDYVSIRDLNVAAVIGVHAWERDVEQALVVSADMATDVRKAAASDDLADALDYSAVAETIAAVLRDGKFRLIETAAERVAGRLLADFPLTWLRLELRKPIAGSPAPNATSTPHTTFAPQATSATPAPATPDAAPVSAASAPGAPPAYTAAITIERIREIP
jgi:7,8-dihydroneopterin aldolase/epimerase/oxygenase